MTARAAGFWAHAPLDPAPAHARMVGLCPGKDVTAPFFLALRDRAGWRACSARSGRGAWARRVCTQVPYALRRRVPARHRPGNPARAQADALDLNPPRFVANPIGPCTGSPWPGRNHDWRGHPHRCYPTAGPDRVIWRRWDPRYLVAAPGTDRHGPNEASESIDPAAGSPTHAGSIGRKAGKPGRMAAINGETVCRGGGGVGVVLGLTSIIMSPRQSLTSLGRRNPGADGWRYYPDRFGGQSCTATLLGSARPCTGWTGR